MKTIKIRKFDDLSIDKNRFHYCITYKHDLEKHIIYHKESNEISYFYRFRCSICKEFYYLDIENIKNYRNIDIKRMTKLELFLCCFCMERTVLF